MAWLPLWHLLESCLFPGVILRRLEEAAFFRRTAERQVDTSKVGVNMRRETGFFESLINAITHTGTTITRTNDIFGRRKTIVRNYDTGITKEYSHDRGFFGNRTDVKVFRGSRLVADGNVKRDFLGRGVIRLKHKGGLVRESVKKMDMGFFGNRDASAYYDKNGRKTGSAYGRQGFFGGYDRSYKGGCSHYN